jgi:hypothetical protein
VSDPEPLVHLGLSHKAAKVLDKMLELAPYTMDGCPLDYIDDSDEAAAIYEAVRTDIKEQLPAPSKGTKRKKGTKK